jgi:hypothetical protein
MQKCYLSTYVVTAVSQEVPKLFPKECFAMEKVVDFRFRYRPCWVRPILWRWNEYKKDRSCGNWRNTVVAGKARWKSQPNRES